MATPFTLARRPFLRDVLFYMVAAGSLTAAVAAGRYRVRGFFLLFCCRFLSLSFSRFSSAMVPAMCWRARFGFVRPLDRLLFTAPNFPDLRPDVAGYVQGCGNLLHASVRPNDQDIPCCGFELIIAADSHFQHINTQSLPSRGIRLHRALCPVCARGGAWQARLRVSQAEIDRGARISEVCACPA